MSGLSRHMWNTTWLFAETEMLQDHGLSTHVVTTLIMSGNMLLIRGYVDRELVEPPCMKSWLLCIFFTSEMTSHSTGVLSLVTTLIFWRLNYTAWFSSSVLQRCLEVKRQKCYEDAKLYLNYHQHKVWKVLAPFTLASECGLSTPIPCLCLGVNLSEAEG